LSVAVIDCALAVFSMDAEGFDRHELPTFDLPHEQMARERRFKSLRLRQLLGILGLRVRQSPAYD
jgi:hypothetical protein